MGEPGTGEELVRINREGIKRQWRNEGSSGAANRKRIYNKSVKEVGGYSWRWELEARGRWDLE